MKSRYLQTAEDDKQDRLEKLYRLILKGNTREEMASILGVSEETILNDIKTYFPHLRDVQLFKDNKEKLFLGIQEMALKEMIRKIPSAQLRDLTPLVGMLEDKLNVMYGKTGNSITNIALSLKIEDIVRKKEQIQRGLLTQGTTKEELNDKYLEHIAVAYDSSVIPVQEVAEVLEEPECQLSVF